MSATTAVRPVRGPHRAGGAGARRRATSTLQRVAVPIVAVIAWEIAARAGDSPFFPPPTDIAVAFWETWLGGPASQLFLSDVAVQNILPSLARMLGGWAVAVVVGVSLGCALGRSATAMDYAGPLLAFARAIPPPALVPVFLVLFELGTPMQLATIIFGVVWPVLLNSADGARSVHPVQVQTAQVFRIPRRQWVFGVVLPAALPKIFAGMRVSLSLALILMVISELVGATNGIGLQLALAQRRFDFDTMWAAVVLLGALGHLFNSVLLAVERRVLAWQPGGTRKGGS
ncbi:ABC transporter permease [Pseudonocardia humida]|uniref:ABC transporter permease n=1 Tax=Pseudonocardia humida TaxID=2800819 RepID=A0ABT1A2S7_9PSEU|nr:ABC transporter permease [Pseudonocardia humida]MCO1657292.1 ABC transporter permease [Pseudonocardia humida]